MTSGLAVCLVSGGLDSGVSAALAGREYRLALLHCNYGQRTEGRELRAFKDLADYFAVPEKLRLVVDLDHFRKIGGSSLTDPVREIPAGEPGPGEVPSTYVPFRNANLLALAVSWGEVIGAKRVIIGAMEEDSSGYPDCREVFFRAFNRAIEFGTGPGCEIRVETPLIHLTKAEVVRRGLEIGAPLHLTWSCYVSPGPEPCGLCASCRLRARGFQEAGVADPAGGGDGRE
jgi:7-cyano-7-deazaguanine synthase